MPYVRLWGQNVTDSEISFFLFVQLLVITLPPRSPLKNAGVALRAGFVLNEEDGGEAYRDDTTTVV